MQDIMIDIDTLSCNSKLLNNVSDYHHQMIHSHNLKDKQSNSSTEYLRLVKYSINDQVSRDRLQHIEDVSNQSIYFLKELLDTNIHNLNENISKLNQRLFMERLQYHKIVQLNEFITNKIDEEYNELKAQYQNLFTTTSSRLNEDLQLRLSYFKEKAEEYLAKLRAVGGSYIIIPSDSKKSKAQLRNEKCLHEIGLQYDKLLQARSEHLNHVYLKMLKEPINRLVMRQKIGDWCQDIIIKSNKDMLTAIEEKETLYQQVVEDLSHEVSEISQYFEETHRYLCNLKTQLYCQRIPSNHQSKYKVMNTTSLHLGSSLLRIMKICQMSLEEIEDTLKTLLISN